MDIRIVSLGKALPKYSATQEEAFAHFGYKSPLTRRVFLNAGIDRRYSWVDPARFKDNPGWQELTQEYSAGATSLGYQAAHEALGEYPVENIGQITFASVTGYTCPSLSYAIAGKLGLPRNVVHSNLLGQGCQASLPALERACDWVRSHPEKAALVVSAEICSATWFPADERDLDYMVSSAIFGDAAAAALVSFSLDTRYPVVLDFESYFDPEYLGLLGYKWEQGRMKVVLSRRVPEIVPGLLKKTVDRLLDRNKLAYKDIAHWIIHPGGKSVLENIEKALGLTHEDTFWSWEAMRQVGNTSSATIGIIGKLMQKGKNGGGYGVVATMGAGTAINAALLRWN